MKGKKGARKEKEQDAKEGIYEKGRKKEHNRERTSMWQYGKRALERKGKCNTPKRKKDKWKGKEKEHEKTNTTPWRKIASTSDKELENGTEKEEEHLMDK